jgi:hypothetical protein
MEDKEYRVRLFMDETYEVVKKKDGADEDDHDYWRSVHQGSLADCEAWIRLTEKGYM